MDDSPKHSGTLTIVDAGWDNWASKEHNSKWVKRIEGTPIRNDLSCHIANEIAKKLQEANQTNVPDEIVDVAEKAMKAYHNYPQHVKVRQQSQLLQQMAAFILQLAESNK